MHRTTPTLVAITIVVATALSLIAATPVSADDPSLAGQPLSLETSEPLLLRLDTDTIVEGDDASGVWVVPNAPLTAKDRGRAHRGSIMTAFGVPLLASGVGALVWTAAVSSTNDCGDPRSRTPYGYAGLAMTTVGVGFSSAGLVALRRASGKARQSKSRRTRVATGLSAAFGTIIGALTLATVGIAGGFCST